MEQIGAVLDLPPVPGFRENVAFFLACRVFGFFSIEDRRFIVLDLARKEAGRWHLLFVPADDDDLAPKQGRQGVFDGHLGGFVEDDGIEEAGLRLEYAARHVGRHEPNGPQCEQAQCASAIDEFAQPQRPLAALASLSVPNLASAECERDRCR